MANRRQNGLESPTMARSYNKGGFKTSWSQKPLHTCNIPTDVRDKYSVETSDMFVNLTSPTTLMECILPTTLIEYWDGPTSPRPGGRKLLLAKNNLTDKNPGISWSQLSRGMTWWTRKPPTDGPTIGWATDHPPTRCILGTRWSSFLIAPLQQQIEWI